MVGGVAIAETRRFERGARAVGDDGLDRSRSRRGRGQFVGHATLRGDLHLRDLCKKCEVFGRCDGVELLVAGRNDLDRSAGKVWIERNARAGLRSLNDVGDRAGIAQVYGRRCLSNKSGDHVDDPAGQIDGRRSIRGRAETGLPPWPRYPRAGSAQNRRPDH